MSYAPVPRYSKRDIRQAFVRQSDLILISFLVPLDLLVTGYMLKTSFIFYDITIFVKPEILTHSTFIMQPEYVRYLEEMEAIQINNQLLNRLIMIKSIVWNMIIINLFRWKDRTERSAE